MSTLLSLFYFFYFGVVGVYVIFMPKVLAMYGYSATDIGAIFAAGPLVRFLLPFAFLNGLKIDIKNFNIAIIIMLISSISFYFSLDSFYKLLISNIGLGIGLSLILPYIEVISLSRIGKERYGKIRLFGSIGFVLVAMVLVKFMSSPETALNYLLAGTFITAIFSFFIAKDGKAKEENKEEIVNDIDLLKDWRLWLGLTMMQVSFGSFYNFFTIYETNNGVSLDITIYLWSFGVLAEIFMLYYQGKFLHNNLIAILQITTLATAFRWLLVFMFPQNIAILFFSQSLHALSFALFHSASISYLYNLYKHKALAQQFFSGITYGLGGFSGALIAGYIYQNYPTYIFLSSTIFALISFFSLYLHAKKVQPQ